MKRLAIACATAAALAFPAVASAWEGVSVEVTFPARATAEGVAVRDFHVFLAGRPLDLATVGPGLPALRPVVTFRKAGRQVTVTARPTARRGVYEARVALPSARGWACVFRYAGLERTISDCDPRPGAARAASAPGRGR